MASSASASALSLSRFLLMLRTTKRWWIPLFVVTAVAINVAGLFQKKKYEAQALVSIYEPAQNSANPVAGVATIDDRMKIIGNEITSPAFLRTIAAKENLDVGIAPDTQQYQWLLAYMADSISLHIKEQSYFTIAYKSNSPEKAQRVTRAIVDLFMKNSDDYFNGKTKMQVTALEAQLKDANAQLQAAQDDLIKYQHEHFNETPQAMESHLKSLSELTLKKQMDAIELQNTQEKLTLAHKRLDHMDPNVATHAVGPEAVSPLQKAIDQRRELEMKLNLTLKDFTPLHPQVVELQSQIAELDKQIAEGPGTATKAAGTVPNRDYADLQNQIAQYELDLKRINSNVDQETSHILTLNTYLSEFPKFKVPLDELENKRRFKEERVIQTMKDLSEARSRYEFERKGLGPSFTISQYPELPMIPVSPNRKKIAVAGVGLGFIAAMGLVLLCALLDNVVRSVDEARAMMQMPILGVVQRIVTPAEELLLRRRRRRRILAASMATTVLFAVVLVGLLFYRDPIQHSLETVQKIVDQW